MSSFDSVRGEVVRRFVCGRGIQWGEYARSIRIVLRRSEETNNPFAPANLHFKEHLSWIQDVIGIKHPLHVHHQLQLDGRECKREI